MTIVKKGLGLFVILGIGAMLVTMGSCSNDDEAVMKSIDQYVALKPVPVSFHIYKAGTAITRAGVPGAINTTDDLKPKGFGVFAYHTEEMAFDSVPVATHSLIPDFMYNEFIVWKNDTLAWSYNDPNDTKYWPNDFDEGVVDDRGADAAVGSKKHYISFFAYAPYAGMLTQVDAMDKAGATSSANEGTKSGIIAVSGNRFNGDPFLTYRLADNSDKTVDLLWGTAGGANNSPTVTGKAQPGGIVTRTVDNGNVVAVNSLDSTNINMTKQVTSGKVTFNFKHALAKLGGATMLVDSTLTLPGMTVDLIIDDVTGPTSVKKATTKVTVKRIRVSSAGADIPSSGVFNLATGIWTANPAVASDTTTYVRVNHLVDQTGTQGNRLNLNIMEPNTVTWDKLDSIPGVLETPQSVYATEVAPLLFIPGTMPSLKFNVEYVVRTKDDKLAKGYTEVTQNITKVLTFTTPLQLNKQYNIAMHLGLTTIKFDATVSEWEAAGRAGAAELHQPINVK